MIGQDNTYDIREYDFDTTIIRCINCNGSPWKRGKPLSDASSLEIRAEDGRMGIAYCYGEDGWEITDESMRPSEVVWWRYKAAA